MVKTLRTETTGEKPRALIFSIASVVKTLAHELRNKGCVVRTEQSQIEDLGSYEYIFLSDTADVVPAQSHLAKSGKMLLFVKDPSVAVVAADQSLKIAAVGDPEAWDPKSLAHFLVKTMFSSQKGVVDLRGKMKRAENIEHITYSFSHPATIHRLSVTPATNQVSIPPSVINNKQSTIKLLVRRYNTKAIALVFFVFLLLVAATAGIAYWYVQGVLSDARSLQKALVASQWDQARTEIKLLQKKVSVATTLYQRITTIAAPLTYIDIVSSSGETLAAVKESLDALDETLAIFSSLITTQGEFSLATGDIAQIQTMQKKLSELSLALSKTQQQLEAIHIPLVNTSEVAKTITTSLDTIEKAKKLIPLYEVLFSREKMRYLVLFQNNMELRPTGGFIGSFAIVDIEGGRMKDFRIIDVYTADGQLKGHVDPPDPIRKHLNQPNWFMRDSNFDPDFALSARQAMFFLEKEMDEKVDGVIGINLFLLQTLLAAVGPLPLSDFGGEVITSQNFFPKANELIHQDFFAGSTQKKDFLTAVASGVRERFMNIQGASAVAFLSSLSQSLEEKHLLLFFADETLQKRVEGLGWAGRMVNVSCIDKNESCFPDYLSVIEANLGANKANYFVQKSVAIEKELDIKGLLSTTVTLSYENKSIASLNQGGPYVNYLRLFVPGGSTIQSVSLNNSPLSTTDVDIVTYGLDKTSVGLLVRIAPENKGVLKMRYTLPRPLAEVGRYQFFYQKQGGDKTSPLVFSFTYPTNVTLSPTNFTAHSAKEGELLYATDTSVDRIFMLQVKK